MALLKANAYVYILWLLLKVCHHKKKFVHKKRKKKLFLSAKKGEKSLIIFLSQFSYPVTMSVGILC